MATSTNMELFLSQKSTDSTPSKQPTDPNDDVNNVSNMSEIPVILSSDIQTFPAYKCFNNQQYNIDDYGSMTVKHHFTIPVPTSKHRYNKRRASSPAHKTLLNRYFNCDERLKHRKTRANSVESKQLQVMLENSSDKIDVTDGSGSPNDDISKSTDFIKINMHVKDESDYEDSYGVDLNSGGRSVLDDGSTDNVSVIENKMINIEDIDDDDEDDGTNDEVETEIMPQISSFRLRRGAVTSRDTSSDYRLYNVVSKNGQRHQVYVCVVFLKIGEIDTIKEQYAADVLIKSKWREPLLDNNTDTPEYDWSNSWSPKLYIENTIGEAKEHVYHMITFNEFNHAFLCEKRRVSGVFLENLELNHFPFDVQDLTITVASNLSTSEIRLVNDPDETHRINKQSFVDEQEWYLYKHIETEQRELAYEYTDPATVRPALSVKCRAARRPAYFIWNIFLVTFLICSLSLVTFAVDKQHPQNRLQLTYTLVLTLVAFKFVVNQCLPKISYLTYLDKYVISSLFILTLICLWHGLIVVIEKIAARFHYELPEDMEVYVIIAMAVSYVGYNVGFIVMIYSVACRRRRDMKQRDKEYVEKVQCQLKYKGMRAMRMIQQTHQLHEVKENGNATFI